MARRQVSIYINGREVENTMKSVRKEVRNVRRELNELEIGSDAYNKKVRELNDLNNVVRKHRDQLAPTKSVFDKMSAGLKGYIGVAAAAFTADAVVRYGKELFRLGAEMEVLTAKAQTVFGDALPSVTQAAEENANAMGLTASQYTDAAAAIGDLLVPMGFARDEAANISTELVDLSGALSEWTGGQVEATEVADILGKAILGEREQLKTLGISINEADINARLAEKGLKGLTGEMLQQAKAAVTLELITQKSTDAQAAFGQNADTLVRKQAELTAKITEVQEKLANALLPVFNKIADAALKFANNFDGIVEGIERLNDPVKGATAAFDDQREKIKNLERELIPLLDSYEDLSNKTNPTKEEQAQLAEVIQRIGEITPTAITEIDEYGRVLSVNTDASREFLQAEKARLQFVNQTSIQSIENEIEKLETLAAIKKEQAETGRVGGLINIRLGANDIDSARKEFAKLSEQIRGAQAELSRLRGDNLNLPTNEDESGATPLGNSRSPVFPKGSGDQAKTEVDKSIKALDQLKDKVQDLRTEFTAGLLPEEEQALAAIEQRYDAELAKASELIKSNNQQIADDALQEILKLEDLKEQALQAEREKQFEARLQRDMEQAQILLDEETKRFEEQQALQTELDAFVAEKTLSDREIELQQLQEHYNALAKAAKQLGVDTTDITRAYRAEISKINEEYNKKDAQVQAQAQAQAFSSLAAAVDAFQKVTEDGSRRGAALAKVLALVNIAAKTAEAIAAGVARAAAAGPFPANLAAIGTTVATVLANVATAKSILNDAPAIPQRRAGGIFDVTGADDGQRYSASYIGRPGTGMLPGSPSLVLASERGPEYFVSNEDLRNPVVLDYVRSIENIRRNRLGQFRDGGATADLTGSTTPQSNTAQEARELVMILAKLEKTLDRGIPAILADQTLVDLRQRLEELTAISGGAI